MTPSAPELFHDTPVCDSYRWLEDRTLPATQAWIALQQERRDNYFRNLSGVKIIERQVRSYLDRAETDQPARVGDQYVYRKRNVGQEQGCLYVQDLHTGKERLLVDPSVDGIHASLAIHRISHDGSHLAYEYGFGGSDRKEIRIVELRTGIILPDRVPLGYTRGFVFAVEGYFYAQDIDVRSEFHEIFFHRYGANDTDAVILRIPRSPGSRLVLKADEERLGAIWLRTKCGSHLMDFLVSDYSNTSIWSVVFREKPMPFVPILSNCRIFALVQVAAKVTQLDEFAVNGQHIRTIASVNNTLIRELAFVQNRVFINTSDFRTQVIDSWSLDGQRFPSLSAPDCGSIQVLPQYGRESQSFFFSSQSFSSPATIYECSPGANGCTRWKADTAISIFPSHSVGEVEIASKDGTRFPMTLVRHQHQPRSGGPAPVIMTSYGGFGGSIKPRFSVLVNILLELGATLALPHIRGGSEFGRIWHEAARARNRQAAFDDFIAAAEWLFREGLTTPRQLGIFGGSNSGLLVGVAMTQRPDLFGAVLCIAPLLDMLRYESFDRATQWSQEYGTVTNEEDFQALYGYSPYHHVAEDVDYPATMFVSGDKDDRCNPAHVRKMAAVLQDRTAQVAPIIVDYCEERGHRGAMPLSTRITALARRIAFLCSELGIRIPKGDADEAPNH